MTNHAGGLVLCVRQPGEGAVTQLLARMRLEARSCADGAAVLREAAGGSATAVIAPPRMADMGVPELIERLRPIAPGIPVLVLTEGAEMSGAVELMRQGARAVVDQASLETELPRQLANLMDSP
jgi:DNA-binding NtrC family response regulator